MKKILICLMLGMFFLVSCKTPPGQIKKQFAPGQMQKKTGYNPASGKHK